jgi:Protein of unknown function (DUF5818)
LSTPRPRFILILEDNKGSCRKQFQLRLAVIARKGGEAVGGEALGGDKHRESFPKVVQSEGEKMKKLMTSIAACVLLAPGLAAAKDKTYNGEIMDSQCAKMGGHESMFKKEGTNDPKACTEVCIKMGGKYVLFNDTSKTFYQLDNQTKPQPFAGQKVEVTGTLDKAGKTIHVTDIKAAS